MGSFFQDLRPKFQKDEKSNHENFDEKLNFEIFHLDILKEHRNPLGHAKIQVQNFFGFASRGVQNFFSEISSKILDSPNNPLWSGADSSDWKTLIVEIVAHEMGFQMNPKQSL